jgi:Hexameric tyrosine-coordinated heme protein (HTHP)
VHLSRAGFIPTGVKKVLARIAQPSDEIRERLRPVYAEDADSLIACSQVIAINFHTLAAANNHRRE